MRNLTPPPVALALLISVGIGASSQAQSNFRFGVEAFGHAVFPIMSSDGTVSPLVLELYKDIESVKAGGGFSAIVDVQLYKHLALELGVGYLQTGVRNKKLELDFGDPPIPMPTPTSSRLIDRHHMLGVPVRFRVQTKEKGSTRLGAFVGMTPILLLEGTRVSRLFYEDGSVQTDKEQDIDPPLRPANLLVTAGIGWEQPIGDQNALLIEPEITYMPLGMAQGVGLNRNLLSVGLRTAIKFH